MSGYKLNAQARANERRWGNTRNVVPIGRGREKRIVTEIPGIERPGANILQVFGIGDATLPVVTIDSALQVPAVLAAVSFLSRCLAALPLHVYRRKDTGPEKIRGGIETLIHEAPNDEWTAFKMRQFFWQQVFTGGRGLIYIERAGSQVVGLYPMNPALTRIYRDGMGRTTYEVEGKKYAPGQVIDIPFMLRVNGVNHYGPIAMGYKAIELALAMNDYGSKFFAGGGVPPLALTGPLPEGPDALNRAMNEIYRAIEGARTSDKPLFPMPPGHELKPVGLDPQEGQMVEARQFQIVEIARVFQLPPVFLQDLTHGTFTNSEQQDLHLVKHLIAQWAQALEEEMNLKLFGQRNGNRYVEHNLDGLLRGDFTTRMEGLAKAVQNSLLSPDEARELENRPPKGGNADKLFIQGATVPIDTPLGARVPTTPSGGKTNGM